MGAKNGAEPNIKIISGNIDYIADQLNQLLEVYDVAQWNYSIIKDELRLTCVLLHSRMRRQQMLATAGMPGRPH